jgi:hypothetical protein
MVLQEGIDFTGYYRCFVVGGQDVLVMPYDPRQPHEHRYVRDVDVTKDPLYERICGDARKLCNALGYEMNTVEFAVRDGVPYAIDYLNPAPDADRHSVGETNFEWIVSKMAEFAVRTVLDPASATAGYRWANYLDRTR